MDNQASDQVSTMNSTQPRSDSEMSLQNGLGKDTEDEMSSNSDTMTAVRLGAIFALAATYTGSQITSLFLGPSIVTIATKIHIGDERSWIPVASSLATICVAPCAGYLQDLVGRKWSLAFGMLCMCVGNIILALSQTFAQLIIGSTLSGIAGALQELTAIAAISELVPAKSRGLFLALNTGMLLCFSPSFLYSQLLSKGNNWRFLFWICLIWNVASALGLGLTYFRIQTARHNQRTGSLSWKQIDFVGIVLLTVGATIFLVGLQAGGHAHAWGSAYVLVQIIIGAILLILLVIWESKAYGKPLIPFRIFYGQRVMSLTLIIGFMGGVNFFSVLNLGPELVQSVFDLSPVTQGLMGLGPGIGLCLGATGANILITALGGRVRELLAFSAVIMTTFSAAQAVMEPTNSVTFAIISAFAGVGIGATLVPIVTIATLACPEDLIGTAVALICTARTVGGTIGYVILYNIFLTKSGTTLPAQMAPLLVEAGLPKAQLLDFITQFIDDVSSGSGILPAANEKILAAAVAGFHLGTAKSAQLVFYVTIPFGILAIISGIFLPNMRQYMTNTILTKSKSVGVEKV